jgi:Outer membrane protein beta-barrel domain
LLERIYNSHLSILAAVPLSIGLILGTPGQAFAQKDSCTFSAGGGRTSTAGKDGNSLNAGWNVQADAGFKPSRFGKVTLYWINVNFMFDELDVSQTALQTARTLNPTNVGLLAATSGRAKFYTVTDDITIRASVNPRLDVYAFGGFGLLRRTLDFSGSASLGSLIQPASPTVFGNVGNSGGFDAGGGVNFKLRAGWKVYAEGRVVHGIGINSGSTLLPISAGIRW